MWLNKEASKKYQFDFCDITTNAYDKTIEKADEN